MSKVRTEYTDVEATPITQTNHGLWRRLVSKAQSRSKGLVSIVNVSVPSKPSVSSHTYDASAVGAVPFNIGEPTLAFTVNRLRSVDLPAQAIVHR